MKKIVCPHCEKNFTEIEMILFLYEKYGTFAEASRIIGISRWSINRRMKKAGYRARAREGVFRWEIIDHLKES